MKKYLSIFLILGLLFSILTLNLLAQKAPDKLVFEAKTGKVTFDHAKHVAREKNNCKTCHDTLFPQKKAPLNFAAGMHKPAEAAKKSCGACHVAGGKAFPSAGNCAKCHVKG
ncbi:MAG: cytochrome c3 family protein [Acidobacteriia bacterium]|nr:cytochrome c3 family protein [Terriglobia bacterium]